MPTKRRTPEPQPGTWSSFNFGPRDRKEYRALKNNSLSRDGKMGNAKDAHQWAHASATKNYMLNSPFLDWVSMYYKYHQQDIKSVITSGKTRTSSGSNVAVRKSRRLMRKNALASTSTSETNMDISNQEASMDIDVMEIVDGQSHSQGLNILFHNGLVYEEKVFVELKNIAPTLDPTNTDCGHRMVYTKDDHVKHKARSDLRVIMEKSKETMKYMSEGVPIIFQGVLVNRKNYTYGIADVLMRSDVINKIFDKHVFSDQLGFGAPRLAHSNAQPDRKKYHYRVIDVKWTTMELCSNGVYIRNSDWIPAYKAQLAVYTAALGQMQGYTPEQAYIMAKSWHVNGKYTEARGYSCFDRLGVVDFSNEFDNKFLELAKKAIKWYHKVSMVGRMWSYRATKPDIPELYPNMCNSQKNGRFGKVKSLVADGLDEITRAWFVGPKHRDIAHSKDIMKMSDPRCTTRAMGMKSTSRAFVIDKLL